MNGIRAAKYAVRAASLVVSILIMVVVAGPILGAVSPQFLTQQQPLGIGLDLQAINSQLGFFNSSSNLTGSHDITVPAFNNWPLAGRANLSLTIIHGNQTLYRSEPASIQLAPFQSGELHLSMVISPELLAQLQAISKQNPSSGIGIGGTMSLSETQFWTITVSFPQ